MNVSIYLVDGTNGKMSKFNDHHQNIRAPSKIATYTNFFYIKISGIKEKKKNLKKNITKKMRIKQAIASLGPCPLMN